MKIDKKLQKWIDKHSICGNGIFHISKKLYDEMTIPSEEFKNFKKIERLV